MAEDTLPRYYITQYTIQTQHTHTRRDVDVRSKAVLHLCAVLTAGPHVVPADVFDVEVERALPADARGRAPPPGQEWLRRLLGRATGVVEDGPRDNVPDMVVVIRAVVLRHCIVCVVGCVEVVVGSGSGRGGRARTKLGECM